MTNDRIDPEVERLRAEVEELKAQLNQPASTIALPIEAPIAPRRRAGWWRPVVATLLVTLMAILAPLSIVAQWANSQVSDTDRYVEAVTPLASDPAVQAAMIDKITTEITTRLQVESVTQQALDGLSETGLPPLAATSLKALATPLNNAINSFVEKQVTRLVESDAFEAAWVQANREAHTQLVAVLTGKDTDTVEITGDAVSINLASIIDTVKTDLVARGFTLAERLPVVNAQFTIFESPDIGKAQSAFRLLGAVSTLLPILALLCLFGAIGVARDRRRTVVVGTLVLAASMVLLGVILNAVRMIYLDAVPTDRLPTDAAAAIYDTLVYFIRLNLRALLVLSLAIAFVAWVTGPGNAPSTVRRGTSQAIGAVRGGGERVGINTGGFGIFLGTYKKALRIVVLVGALLIYVMAAHPTGQFTIVLLIVAGVVLLIIELLSRPPDAVELEPSSSPGSP